VNDYLTFTRFERIGIITILVVIGLLILSSVFSTYKTTNQKLPDTAWINAVRELEQKEIDRKPDANDAENSSTAYQYDPSKNSYYNNRRESEMFYFDPNTLSKSEWQKLGLRDKTIGTIQNYLSKGGHFKKAEDLKRVYGLRNDEYEQLAPFVKIEGKPVKDQSFDLAVRRIEKKPTFSNGSRYNIIEINAADTTAFISLPGIGSKLAGRIVNFRDKLGGFFAVEQVRETFGLPDSTFEKIRQYLKLEHKSIRKININTATVDELKAHPYIRYSLANSIIAYRNQHGPFSNIEGIKKIMVITDDIYIKISPYLTLGL
jgi:competence ComEA-like helix-hairpin-helix protein